MMATQKNNIPVIQARDFTSTYDATEDRIRVVINYNVYEKRVDLWLTRALFLKLLPMLEEFIEKYEVKTQPKPVSKEEKKATFDAAFQSAQKKTEMSTLAVMEKEPLLLKSVDMSYVGERGEFVLVFKTDTLHAKAVFKPSNARVVMRSIFNAAPHIAWGISPRMIES